MIEAGAASLAGVKSGDVILKFQNVEVTEVSQLLDLIGRHRPGDKVTLTIRRNDSVLDLVVTLQNEIGGTRNMPNYSDKIFGASFVELTTKEKRRHSLKYGIKVAEVFPGKFMSAGIKSGLIITKINNHKINSVQEAKNLLKIATEGVYIEAYNPRTRNFDYYAFGIH